MNKKPRKQFNGMLFGAQGSGKTIVLLEFILRYHRRFPWKRILIILPDDQEEKFDAVPEIFFEQVPTFTGIKKLIAGKKTIKRLRDYYLPDPEEIEVEERRNRPRFNGLIVYDDPGVYLGRFPEPQYELMGRRRQLNADMLSAFPGIRKKAPPGYYGYATHIYLSETTDSPDDLVNELPEDKREEFLAMYRSVQQEAKNNPYHMEELVIRKIVD